MSGAVVSEDHKRRVQQAVERNAAKAERKRLGPQRKNQKPEDVVRDACLKWMRARGWDMQIFESKATFSQKKQRFISQSMKAGTTDSGGSTSFVEPAWVEFKAPGKLSTLRDNQREFIINKINHGCFACVVDSVERLDKIYTTWRETKTYAGISEAVNYLLRQLPPKKADKDDDWDLY